MTQITKLETQLRTHQRNGDYAKAAKTMAQLEKLRHTPQRVALKSLLPSMTEQDKREALRAMHRVFILADMLDGFAIDFQEVLRKFDPTITVNISQQASTAAKQLQQIVKELDLVGSPEMSQEFGDMCDRIKLNINNEIFKLENKWK